MQRGKNLGELVSRRGYANATWKVKAVDDISHKGNTCRVVCTHVTYHKC